jgi:hypothetical protein
MLDEYCLETEGPVETIPPAPTYTLTPYQSNAPAEYVYEQVASPRPTQNHQQREHRRGTLARQTLLRQHRRAHDVVEIPGSFPTQYLTVKRGGTFLRNMRSSAMQNEDELYQQPPRPLSQDPFYQQTYQPSLTRKRTVIKRLELYRGNLVINCPVPDRLLNNVQIQTGEEFSVMRYSAVTCDPDRFSAENYTLRQPLYGRETEMMIIMTMYNEVKY